MRTRLRQQRRALSAQEVSDKSQQITARLVSCPIFRNAQTVILYSPNESEVETDGLWQNAHSQGKRVYYPRITPDKSEIEFVLRGDGDSLIPGVFDILIPPGEELLWRVATTDLVLTPGVGFDRLGHRLGRGRGYYDRAFRAVLAKAVRVGLAYETQMVAHIPSDPNDESMDYLVTEKQLIQCS